MGSSVPIPVIEVTLMSYYVWVSPSVILCMYFILISAVIYNT